MYKVTFETEVPALSSTRRYEGNLFVKADTPKAARDKAESFIKNAYSDTFVIMEVLPVSVIE